MAGQESKRSGSTRQKDALAGVGADGVCVWYVVCVSVCMCVLQVCVCVCTCMCCIYIYKMPQMLYTVQCDILVPFAYSTFYIFSNWLTAICNSWSPLAPTSFSSPFYFPVDQNPTQVSMGLQVFHNLSQLPSTLLTILTGFKDAIQYDIQHALDPTTLSAESAGKEGTVQLFVLCTILYAFVVDAGGTVSMVLVM